MKVFTRLVASFKTSHFFQFSNETPVVHLTPLHPSLSMLSSLSMSSQVSMLSKLARVLVFGFININTLMFRNPHDRFYPSAKVLVSRFLEFGIRGLESRNLVLTKTLFTRNTLLQVWLEFLCGSKYTCFGQFLTKYDQI
jgi:hypothetical protein